MPVYSMTGYAAVQSSIHVAVQSQASTTSRRDVRLGLEIRSVNSRFLDLAFRLPDELRHLEPALREVLSTKLKRGKVELRVGLNDTSNGGLQAPTAMTLQRLNTLEDTIKAWLPQATPFSVADVMRLASVQDKEPHDHSEELLKLAKKALKELLSAREREGGRLAAMLLNRTTQIRALCALVTPMVPKLVSQQKAKFLERFKEAMALSGDAGMPEASTDRALTEATAFAIRIDVAEEVVRLSSHLDEMERLLIAGGELGKQLDFLTQELHREANTLGSKSSSLELTRVSVDMKVLIEQIREQVQNIE